MNICFFGAYNPGYPRNAVLRRGLEFAGAEVSECRVWPPQKFWVRYPLLILRFAGLMRKRKRPRFLLVPEFCQKDVPLAKFISLMYAAKVVFDPLASRFETKITDWRRKPEGSAAAWWNFQIDRWSLKLADIVLADTEAHKDYYCRTFGIPAAKVAVVPVGFDDREFSGKFLETSASDSSPSDFRVFFFGSFLPLHGAEVILRAAQLVGKRDRTIRFTFIGSGQTKPGVLRVAAEEGLANVCFYGWMAQRDLARKVASEADLCLGIFGKTEKAERVVPHKVFQAMAMRKPVITLQTPAAEEFFSHRENIYFCPKPDPEMLAEAILDLRRDEALRGEIARRGYELVRENYRPEALGRLLLDVFKKKGTGTYQGRVPVPFLK